MALRLRLVHPEKFLNSFDHHEAVWMVVAEEGRLLNFPSILLLAILGYHLVVGQLTCSKLAIILISVASTLVDEVKEEVHAVETVSLTLTQHVL